jgi:uncharacterized membrane protein
MDKGRVEAFTDGVIAVIITIMVLELKAPHAPTWPALFESWPIFLSYILSFIYVGIYWNNHHHLMHPVERIDGRVMWSNLFFLFCLSLFPFGTAWLNEGHDELNHVPALVPTVLYGIILMMTAISWIPLSRSLIAVNGGAKSELAKALGDDWKGKVSVLIYAAAIALAFLSPIISCVMYAVVAAIWFVPDRRIEGKMVSH